MRIIEVNPEDVDLTEAIKTHTKANIRAIAIKVIITKVIMVYIITHA